VERYFDVELKELKPYSRNPRRHTQKQIDNICASIREFGFCAPVLIDENKVIIAGHGRVAAAKKMNWEKVPCVVLEGLSQAQKRAYIIADNRLTEVGSYWDRDGLEAELREVLKSGIDLETVGYTESDLRDLEREIACLSGGNAEMESFFTAEAKQRAEENQRKSADEKEALCPTCGRPLQR